MPYYAVMLDMTDKHCLIVGAGAVSERKTQQLLNCGAKITVVSPTTTERFEHWLESRQITIRRKRYSADDLQAGMIVFACTNDKAVNSQICADAKQKGLWVNAADQFEQGDFIVPAQVLRGKLHMAVSTAGASPALTKRVAAEIQERYGIEYEAYTHLLHEFRETVLLQVTDAKRRQKLLKKAAEDHRLLDWIRADRREEARKLCFSFLQD
ncbi:bifunctional precorrin-2 dehydrogenase/sirohydrochlorin ferrochelatase [Marinicrinis lubricantis]